MTPAAAPAEHDDAWLRATTAAAAVERPRPVDWTPEPTPSAPPPSEAAAPVAAAPPAAAAGESGPTASEREPIPDVASLDTLLPDRTKGGSISPGR